MSKLDFNEISKFKGVVYFFEKNNSIFALLNLKNKTYSLKEDFSEDELSLISFYGRNFFFQPNKEETAINVSLSEKDSLKKWLRANFNLQNRCQ